MNNVIIYAGGFGLPDRTGSAQRCSGNVMIWQALGYETVVLAKLPDAAAAGQAETYFNARCLDIRDPYGTGEGGNYTVDAKAIAQVAEEIGLERLKAVAVYNYPARGLCSVLAWARASGVPVISDFTEWYPWEGSRIVRNVLRQIGMVAKVHLLNHLAGNVILASKWMEDHYTSTNTLIMPGVYDTQDARFAPVTRPNGPVRFFYGGSPGMTQQKDSLGELIYAMAQLKDQGAVFHTDIVGVSENQYLDVQPKDRDLITSLGTHVRFWGRVPHYEALRLLKEADYSVFFRPLTRQNEAGFPGKYIEAVMAGVPVITNATSDLASYQRDGVNGFLATGMDTLAIREALQRALTLSPAETAAMRRRRDDKAFSLDRWRAPMTRFMDALLPVSTAPQALRNFKRVPLRKNTATP